MTTTHAVTTTTVSLFKLETLETGLALVLQLHHFEVDLLLLEADVVLLKLELLQAQHVVGQRDHHVLLMIHADTEHLLGVISP